MKPTLPSKLCAPADVARCASLLARPLVFTSGMFDVLHRGHVESLKAAASLGRSLVVGLNSDAGALALGKGPDRPLNTEIDRAFMLDALHCVTMIVLFDEHKPLELLRLVRPDIYVKGGDDDVRELEEARLVESWGGRALALGFVPGYSTTSLMERIRRDPRRERPRPAS
jgi:rfaE bifunctional protein nucleotidyltransferase chain/domain